MIWEFAGAFVRLGNTQRQKLLDRYMTEYLRFNPDTDLADATAIRSDMEALAERKLKLFPRDSRLIISADLVPTGNGDRIEVVSIRTGREGVSR